MSLTTGDGNSNPLLGFGDYSGLAIPAARRAAGFSGAALIAGFLDSSAGASGGRVSEILASGSARNLSQAIDQLNPTERNALQARWGRSLEELVSLSNEHDARVFHHGLLQVGRRLEDNDQVDLAGVVYSSLVADATPHPALRPPSPPRGEGQITLGTSVSTDIVSPSPLGGEGARRADEGSAVASIAAQAQRRLNAINGVGDWRERFAFSLQRIPGQATRWDVLFAMTGAGLTFRGFRLLTTASWAGSFESALALNAASASTAFLAETIAFTSLGKVAGALAGHPQDTSANGIFNEWAGGAAMLLGLKGMGALTGAGVRSIYGEGVAATATGRLTQILAPQAGMFMGILIGNRLAEAGGFHPGRHGDTWLVDGITTLIEFNVAGGLQRAAGGPALISLEARMDAMTRSMASNRPRLSERLNHLMSGLDPQFVTPEGIRLPDSVLDRPNAEPNAVFSVRHDGTGGGRDSEPPISSVRPSAPPSSRRVPVAPEVLGPEGFGHDRSLEASAYASDLIAIVRNGADIDALDMLLNSSAPVDPIHVLRSRAAEDPAFRQALAELNPLPFRNVAEEGQLSFGDFLVFLAEHNPEAHRAIDQLRSRGLFERAFHEQSLIYEHAIAHRNPVGLRQLRVFADHLGVRAARDMLVEAGLETAIDVSGEAGKTPDVLPESLEAAPESSRRVVDTTPEPNWLFITGGSSGIGESLVLQAHQRGYQILFGGSRPFNELPHRLQELGVERYLPVNVRNYENMSTFRDLAMLLYRQRPGPMLVMASAGISARGSDAELKRMWETNVGGTNALLETFQHPLALHPRSRFAGVGSIVAAEGVAVRGDEAYQGTKIAIHQSIQDLHRLGLSGFSLIPGAVDTPMTRRELVFGFLIQNMAVDALRSGSPLNPLMRELFGEARVNTMTPAELLRTWLGETLVSAANNPGSPFNYTKIDKLLTRDPQLTPRTQLILASELLKSPEVADAIANTLTQFDAVVGPDLVAQRTLQQFESGEIPPAQMLKVYSRSGRDLILRLLGAPPPAPSGGANGSNGAAGLSHEPSPRAESVPPPSELAVPRVPDPEPTPVREVPAELRNPDLDPAAEIEAMARAAASEKPTAQTGFSSIGIRREGTGWAQDVIVTPKEARYYAMATGNVVPLESGMLPAGMSFSKNLRGTFEGLGDAMRRAPRPTVIHGSEKIEYLRPWRMDLPATIRNSSKTRGKEGQPQTVIADREIRNLDGELLVSGRSLLAVGPDYSEIRPTVLSEADLQKLGDRPVLELRVTRDLAETFAEASGDYNPVHLSEAGAKELGLPGQIFHGMGTFNFAERALFQHLGGGPRGPYSLKANFRSIALTESTDGSRPGDVLRFYVEGDRSGAKTTVINQRNEHVMSLEYSPLPAPEVRAPALDASQIPPARNKYGRFEVDVDVAAGYRLVQKAVEQMAPHLPRLREALGERIHQPWFIAGMSDGMGFHYASALLAAGVRHLVGGYYEPDALLKSRSEVHLARVARAAGLQLFAKELGANVDIIYENLVLSEWRNKDENKQPLARPEVNFHPLPESVRIGIEASRRQAWVGDLNAANSIAFAQHISPSPGVERLTGIPSLDLEGNVILADMKPYDEAKYQQGTIDPMGRNQEALLSALTPYFGPKSTSYFFTWAGGSQNFHIMHGIYGGSSLGEAKEIGETATVSYHLRSRAGDYDRGYHKVVRFPDFPTFALFGIPGGGGMGMIARHVLEGHSRYMDVPDLAPLSLIAALGGENNLRNPVSQIEMDVPESYHIREIKDDLEEFHRRVREHRVAHPDRWIQKKVAMFTIPTMTPEDSRAILLGSAVDYRRDHPELEGQPIPSEVWRELRSGPNRPLVAEDYANHIPKPWD